MMFSRTWVRCIKKGSFSLREKARMRGYKSRRYFVLLISSPQSSPCGRGG